MSVERPPAVAMGLILVIHLFWTVVGVVLTLWVFWKLGWSYSPGFLLEHAVDDPGVLTDYPAAAIVLGLGALRIVWMILGAIAAVFEN